MSLAADAVDRPIAMPPTVALPDGPELLKRLRTEAGLSQNQLAIRARIDPAYVNRIERRLGHHAPSRAVILRLTAALGLDLDGGDRLLHSFGLAGRIDWQAAYHRLAAEAPSAAAEAVDRTLADAFRGLLATAEPLDGDAPTAVS